jgi:hypothetical protein
MIRLMRATPRICMPGNKAAGETIFLPPNGSRPSHFFFAGLRCRYAFGKSLTLLATPNFVSPQTSRCYGPGKT